MCAEDTHCKGCIHPSITLKQDIIHLLCGSEDLQKIIQTTELKYQPDELTFTDGSRKEIPNVGLVTGSGIYRKLLSAPLSLSVKPYGQGMLNTINKAELIAILVALKRCRPDMNECIATDSRCSMQKIAKHL